MEEVYRSFDVLGVECQHGYEIYELENFYEVRYYSVETPSPADRVRIRKELLTKEDFRNQEKLGRLQADIENGCADYGQCWYNQKWYGYDTICKIQASNQDYRWKRYV